MINQSIIMQSVATPFVSSVPVTFVAPCTFMVMNSNPNTLFSYTPASNFASGIKNPRAISPLIQHINPQINPNQNVFSIHQMSSQQNNNLINQQQQNCNQPQQFYFQAQQNQVPTLLVQNPIQLQQQQLYQQYQFQQYQNTSSYAKTHTLPNEEYLNFIPTNQQQQHQPSQICNYQISEISSGQSQKTQENTQVQIDNIDQVSALNKEIYNNHNQQLNENQIEKKSESVNMKSQESISLPPLEFSKNDKKRSSVISTISTASCNTKNEGDSKWLTSDQSIQSKFHSQESNKEDEIRQNELLNTYEPHIQVFLKQMYEQYEKSLTEQFGQNGKESKMFTSPHIISSEIELQECFKSNKYLKWSINTNRTCSFASQSSQSLISTNKKYFNLIKLNKKIKKQFVSLKKINNINQNNQKSVHEIENTSFNQSIEILNQIKTQNQLTNLQDSNSSTEYQQYKQSISNNQLNEYKITQKAIEIETFQFSKESSIIDEEDSQNEQNQIIHQQENANLQKKGEECELKTNISKKTVNSRFHNMNKLFMYKLLAQFFLENLESLGVPFYIREIFKKLISMVKQSSKQQKNKKAKQKTDFFSHDHYNLLFLTLNSQTIKYLSEYSNNNEIHQSCFNLDLSQVKLPLETSNNSQDIIEKIEYINVIKKYACEIILSSELGDVFEQVIDNQCSQEEITKQIYTKRALSGIQILNKGIVVRRF